MSVQVSFGATSKRINSTSQTYTAYASNVEVILKEPCSSQTPVFRVTRSAFGNNPLTFNYAQWGSWYYWVDDIVYLTNDIIEIHCHLDPLATYKTAITGSYGLVIYGDSAHHNEYADDTRFYPEKLYHSQTPAHADIFGLTPEKGGTIVMTFTQTASVDWMSGSSAVTSCGIHTAIMSVSEFMAAMGDLTNFDCLTGWSGDGALEIVQAFQRLVQSTGGGSIVDNIQRAIWIPFNTSNLLTAIGSANYTQRQGLMLGGVLAANTVWYETSNTFVLNHNGEIALAMNDLVGSHGFLKNDRWLSVQVTTPGGYSAIPTDTFKDSNYIYFRSSLCINDGSYSVKICRSRDSSDQKVYNDAIASFSGCLGVNVKGAIYGGPTTSSMIADAGAAIVTGALGIAGGAMIGGAVAGMEGGADMGSMIEAQGMKMGYNQISSGIQGAIPGASYNISAPSGSFGGSVTSMFLTPTAGKMTVYAECWAPKDIANYDNYCARYGYPCNSYMQLSSLASGSFCQCAGFTVQGAAGATEAAKSTINSYVNSGIYLD